MEKLYQEHLNLKSSADNVIIDFKNKYLFNSFSK